MFVCEKFSAIAPCKAKLGQKAFDLFSTTVSRHYSSLLVLMLIFVIFGISGWNGKSEENSWKSEVGTSNDDQWREIIYFHKLQSISSSIKKIWIKNLVGLRKTKDFRRFGEKCRKLWVFIKKNGFLNFFQIARSLSCDEIFHWFWTHWNHTNVNFLKIYVSAHFGTFSVIFRRIFAEHSAYILKVWWSRRISPKNSRHYKII